MTGVDNATGRRGGDRDALVARLRQLLPQRVIADPEELFVYESAVNQILAGLPSAAFPAVAYASRAGLL